LIKELILVRHGKAEDRNKMVDDAQRGLTEEGVKEFRQSLPTLSSLMHSWHNTLVWTSPLQRAVQTAALITDLVGTSEMQKYEFIRDGDWKAFSRRLAGVKQSEYLIVVGHQPYLSDWSKCLTGLPLPFKKGSAAGFRLKSIAPLQAELMWFLQPKALRRLDTPRADILSPPPPRAESN